MSEVTAKERHDAERIARALACPSPGVGALDVPAPLTHREKAIVENMVARLVARPRTPLEAVRNAADLVDMAGGTSNAHADGLGLWEEFRDLARRHPAEFEAITGSDMAEQCLEFIVEKMDGPASTREGIAIKARQVRDALAGPRPSPVEFCLAEAAALSWLDYHRCVMRREQVGDATVKELTYHDSRVDKAHRRYVRSLKALAAVRKIDTTAIQINVGAASGPVEGMDEWRDIPARLPLDRTGRGSSRRPDR